MTDQKINADRITKPIQLLAAWLIGLLLINTTFLTAAGAISSPAWVRALLVIASVVNVPLFLGCLFLLQTKFRPQLQEDSYYSKYLESNTGVLLKESKLDIAFGQIRAELSESHQNYVEMLDELRSEMSDLSSLAQSNGQKAPAHLQSDSLRFRINEASMSRLAVRINDLIPDYKEIRAQLIAAGMPLGPIFGSTSVDPTPPELLTLVFGRAVPVESLRKAVRIARENGFDRIHYASSDTAASAIYFGSYIYKHPDEPQPVQMTADILEVIESSASSIADVIAAIAHAQARA